MQAMRDAIAEGRLAAFIAEHKERLSSPEIPAD